MMPILPIVRVNNIDQAIDLAVEAEHGKRHTAHMHSKNIDNLKNKQIEYYQTHKNEVKEYQRRYRERKKQEKQLKEQEYIPLF